MKSFMGMALAVSFVVVGFSHNAEARKKSHSYAQAKQACLAGDPELKGKELQKCIKKGRKG